MNNIFVERLWRTVEYEDVYLKSYETVAEARESLARYFHFYNTERLHESLDYRIPREAYFNEGRQKDGSETKPAQASLHQIQPSFLSWQWGQVSSVPPLTQGSVVAPFIYTLF